MINFLFSLNIVWGLFCCILYLISGVDPQKFWFFSISSLLIPVSFAINLLFIFIWIFFRWKYGVLSVIILLLGIGHIKKFYALNERNENTRCQTSSFRMMSFNIYGLKNTRSNSEQLQESRQNQFLSFLRKSNPDILCVQENNLYADRIIQESGIFKYVHYMISHGTGIYSKFPILDQGVVEFGKMTNSCLWVDVLVQGNKIRLYNAHLESNRISKDVNQLKDEEEDPRDKKIGLVRDILRKYRRMSTRRARQADLISRHADSTRLPVIITGDFNDTPYSYAYARLSKNRKDSFLERGFGIGTTFVGLLPGLRIDFILADEKKLDFCSHKVQQTSFSDHNPLIVEIFSK